MTSERGGLGGQRSRRIQWEASNSPREAWRPEALRSLPTLSSESMTLIRRLGTLIDEPVGRQKEVRLPAESWPRRKWRRDQHRPVDTSRRRVDKRGAQFEADYRLGDVPTVVVAEPAARWSRGVARFPRAEPPLGASATLAKCWFSLALWKLRAIRVILVTCPRGSR